MSDPETTGTNWRALGSRAVRWSKANPVPAWVPVAALLIGLIAGWALG